MVRPSPEKGHLGARVGGSVGPPRWLTGACPAPPSHFLQRPLLGEQSPVERAEGKQCVHPWVSCSLRSRFAGAPIVSWQGVQWAAVHPPARAQAPTGHQAVPGAR